MRDWRCVYFENIIGQMVMAVFAYIYHQSFVASQSISVESILDQVGSFPYY